MRILKKIALKKQCLKIFLVDLEQHLTHHFIMMIEDMILTCKRKKLLFIAITKSSCLLKYTPPEALQATLQLKPLFID
ncbi:hypothetical protein [Bartonella sp. AU18XJBT]|uniref:hypothetical protein n=1 Tax=Bartonella sp. AU18XJBT TaxID=3019089 RepID=UPI002362D972|nr:hypothetical protein [Bartonella sp. AU18XJBT]